MIEGGKEEERIGQEAIVFDWHRQVLMRHRQVLMTKTWHISKRGRQKAKPWRSEVQASSQLSPEPIGNRGGFMQDRGFNG